MPPPKKTKRSARDLVINIRVSAEHKEAFAKAANALGMDVSAFLRMAALEKIARGQ